MGRRGDVGSKGQKGNTGDKGGVGVTGKWQVGAKCEPPRALSI